MTSQRAALLICGLQYSKDLGTKIFFFSMAPLLVTCYFIQGIHKNFLAKTFFSQKNPCFYVSHAGSWVGLANRILPQSVLEICPPQGWSQSWHHEDTLSPLQPHTDVVVEGTSRVDKLEWKVLPRQQSDSGLEFCNHFGASQGFGCLNLIQAPSWRL